MYLRSLFFVAILFSSLLGISQTNEFQGIIQTDTTWSGGTISITGDVIIPSGRTLIIEKGTKILLMNASAFDINGRLKALGIQGDSVVFTVNDTCLFSDTSSVKGGWGGLRFTNNTTGDTSILSYCKIQYGKSLRSQTYDSCGGGIYAKNYKTLIISHSDVSHNFAHYAGGGIYMNNKVNGLIENCKIHHNHVYYEGGGVYVGDSCDVIFRSNVVYRNISYGCVIIYPWVVFWGSGGGLHCTSVFYKSPLIINNYFSNNTAVSGGALYTSNLFLSASQNVFCNNEENAIYIGHQLCRGILNNNNIVNNYGIGGVKDFSHYCIYTNNIIYGNVNIDNPGIQLANEETTTQVNYCNVQNGFEGVGNIDAPPCFVCPSKGSGIQYDGLLADWSLLDNSPCINAGNLDTTGLFLPLYDLAGNPRIFGFRIDMGAYENQNVIAGINVLTNTEKPYVYPNPATGSFQIKNLAENKDYLYKLYDITGNLISEGSISKEVSASINCQNVTSGMYFLQIISGNDNQSIKIQIQ